jgi:hypothetical protein
VRWTLVATLAGLALAAGCVGSQGEELEEQAAEPALEGVDRAGVAWSTSQASAAAPENVTLPASLGGPAGGVHAHVLFRVDEPGARLNATLEHPNGETYGLVDQLGATGGVVEDHLILPGYEGPASLVVEGVATGEARLEVDLGAAPPAPAPEPFDATGTDERPVVAVVDTGVNPYHEAFQRDWTPAELPDRLPEGDRAPVALDLDPQATYGESLREDASVWTQAPSNQLFHVEGTNLLGVDLRERSLPQLPVLDTAGHGTSVAHAVSREDPGALVVTVTAEDYDDGVRWIAEQPWIDLVSLSWGPAVNAAGAGEPYATGFDTYNATRTVHENGQVVFAATGNDPTPAFTDTTSGPPWVHAVSGAEPDAKGRAIASGNLVDTVANWTQELAAHRSVNETRTGSGTSFATPTTAGIAARILHEVRQAVEHEGSLAGGPLVDGTVEADAGDLRHALNRTAVYWNTTDYRDPREGPSAPPAPTPWANMGWGYLDGSRVNPAVAGLLGEEALPDKPDEAEAFMEANLELRKQWWGVERP